MATLMTRPGLRLRRLFGLSPGFGDIGRTVPVSRHFGYDRGTPVDRYYIDRFLTAQADRIVGRTLEIGDDSYTARFGGTRTTRRDVLHVSVDHATAAFRGDLTDPALLPAGAFDCAVITQTLHLIFDMRAAVANLHDALRPGGVLLMTVPGISQIAADEWGEHWRWSLTARSLGELLGERFGAPNVTIASYGNVFAATGFLQGLALEELPRAKLDVLDPLYPVIVAAVAIKPGAGAA